MDDPMHLSMNANLEVEERLDRYARVRLSPDPLAVARMRARVMREARLSMAGAAGARTALSAELTTHPVRRLKLARRAAGLLAAAFLSLALATGAMAASQAGGPLYEIRVSLESLALPSDPGRRTEAEIVRLEARMAEAVAAARNGDQPAVQAALRSYEEIADEALAGAGLVQDALDRIHAALQRHVAILQAVAAGAPAQAQEAIEQNVQRAIEKNATVLERIEAASQPPGKKPATPPAGQPAGGNSPKPAKTDAAAPTHDNAVSAPPKPTNAPAKTSKPIKAPVATPAAAEQPPAGGPTDRPGRTPPAPGGNAP
jgi:hypothetical protein